LDNVVMPLPICKADGTKTFWGPLSLFYTTTCPVANSS
jgi:hypothetical protein